MRLLSETIQEESWQTITKKPVRTRFAVVLRTMANIAALHAKALETQSNSIAIADMKIAVETSKSW